MKKIISLIIITLSLISCSNDEEYVTACIEEGTITEDGVVVYAQDQNGNTGGKKTGCS